MTALITSADYAAALNESIDDLPAAYVAGVFEAVSAEAERWTGRAFTLASRTVSLESKPVVYHGQEVLKVTVPYAPIVSVTSVEVWYAILSGEPTALDVANAWTDAELGVIYVPFGRFGTWQTFFATGRAYKTRVAYTAGTGDPVPADVKRALALLAKEQFAADAAASRSDLGTVVSYTVAGEYAETRDLGTRAATAGLGLGTRLAASAMGILARYRRSGAVFV